MARKNFSTQVFDWVRTIVALVVAVTIITCGAAGAYWIAIQLGVIA